MMEEVGIGDAIDCRIHCNGEAEHGGDVFEAVFVRQIFSKGSCNLPSCDSRDHGAAGHGFDKKDEWHYG